MQITLPQRALFSWSHFFTGSLMVFGTTVGAGMLGIPLMTAAGGFSSALLVTCAVWLFMALTGLLLLEVTFYMPKGSNLLSMSSSLLQKKGKWVTIVFFFFLYYAFLVAYFSGGAPLLGECLKLLNVPCPRFLELPLFAGVFGAVIFLGPKAIHRTNSSMSLAMIVLFLCLMFLGAPCVSGQKLFAEPLCFAHGAIPVLFGAFGFHNVVPSLAHHFQGEKAMLRGSIVFGTFLAFALYVVWQWLVLGSLSQPVLQEVLQKGLPVTYALSQSSSEKVWVLGQNFGFLALTTSFLGVSLSLVDFIRDGLDQKKLKISRLGAVCLALFPPLVCVYVNPHLFDRALGVAGGFGEALLNGALPVLLFAKMKRLQGNGWQKVRHQMFFTLLLAFSVYVMYIELVHLL